MISIHRGSERVEVSARGATLDRSSEAVDWLDARVALLISEALLPLGQATTATY